MKNFKKNYNSCESKKNIKKYFFFIILFFSLSITCFSIFNFFYRNKNKSNEQNHSSISDTDESLFPDKQKESPKDSKTVNSKKINVAYCTDNNYVYPTIVSMFSLMDKSDYFDNYKISVLISSNVTEENQEKIKSIEKKFENCSVDIINMQSKFSDLNNKGWGNAMYYRLCLPQILKDVKVCLYLDGDTIVLKDIREIFDIDLGGNFVAGIRDYNDHIKKGSDYNNKIGIKNFDTYICSGVLLMNLQNIRDKKIDEKLFKSVEKNSNEFIFPDQDAINSVCYGNIKPLACKWGFLIHTDYDNEYEKSEYAKWASNKEDWNEGRTDPYIVHFTNPKSWSRLNKFANFWWQTAKKTEYFEEIRQKYVVALDEENKKKFDSLNLLTK